MAEQQSQQEQDFQPMPPMQSSGTPPPLAEQAPQASSESADVEITDIPVDENGDPIIEPATSQSRAAEPATPAGRSAEPSGETGGTAVAQKPLNPDLTGPTINLGASTNAERLSKLENNLDGKLAEFDEMMRKTRLDAERERVTGGGGQGSQQSASPNELGGGGARNSSGLGNTPNYQGTSTGGEVQRAAGAIPSDIPAGRDDDIVARQLREAATREADPVLREKLWDEYRKYTKGTSR
jgi:hypothetical protein